MARCEASKPDGSPCERIVSASQTHCYAHDPERSAERRRNASNAAKSKPNKEIVVLKAHLKEIAEDVRTGELEPRQGAVMVQCLNSVRALMVLERDIKEMEELERRLEHIEYLQGGRKWGA